MAKRGKTTDATRLRLETGVLRHVLAPKHRPLFLPKLLAAAAKTIHQFDVDAARNHEIIKRWADLLQRGALNQKETALDADFLDKIFGDALGYPSPTDKPERFHRRKHPTIAGAGGDTPDGALGTFRPGHPDQFTALIELKGVGVDLDHHKSNGRTPVDQLWDYLIAVPECPWGILSNYVTLRLYHRDRTKRAYEEFNFVDLIDPDAFERFYYLLHRKSLIGDAASREPRTLKLLDTTRRRQRDVGEDLYKDYSLNRHLLIEHLRDVKQMPEADAVGAAQRLMDRAIFIAFCDDRGLLPDETLKRFGTPPKIKLAVNPVWQQFKALFGMIDRGDAEHDIQRFNGNLFKPDPLIDALELPDDLPTTQFFARLDEYDFRDDVNVDVLGNLFERSITELEKFRAVGLYAKDSETAAAPDGPLMPKSAERKRFGTYYTPPDFTQRIVEETIGTLIGERVDALPDADYAKRLDVLRSLRIIDPACGSGAFLIAAYELLDGAYKDVAKLARIAGDDAFAQSVEDAFPDHILRENLYGVDLSAEAVEITQLALWLQSARKGRTLADLSTNVRRGNSLVSDAGVHPQATTFEALFPDVMARGGFDCVIGNPPWERMKLQEREFFALGAADIAAAVSAAERRKLIARIETDRPALHARYVAAADLAERTLAHVRAAGRFPFTARGDVNTYMLFAELARTLVHPDGLVGLLLPSGIATDKTTAPFFNDLMDRQALRALYDFENRKGVFPDVDGRFKFSILLVNGANRTSSAADFVFFAHGIEDLADKRRHVALSQKDLRLLNPNTRTCPIFRTERDAEITKAIYRQVQVLIDHNRNSGGNPWGASFVRMFDQTNDAEHFVEPGTLKADGYRLEGNRWIKGKRTYLPLYEAKMLQMYDHRAAGIRVAAGNWMRQGQPEDTSPVDHANPEFVVLPRFWASAEAVDAVAEPRDFAMAYKDVTSATNQRTMIAAWVPRVGLMNSAPAIYSDQSPRRQCCLLANFNSLAYDFVARQKVGGLHLNFFIVEQLPTLPPDAYDDPCPWDRKQTLEAWVSERVLRLTCTSNDMRPLAEAAGFTPGVVKWKEAERATLRAELDAAYFRLYGLSWEDVDYVLTTFQGIRDEDGDAGTKAEPGEGETRRLIREAWATIA